MSNSMDDSVAELNEKNIFVQILSNYPNIFRRPTSKSERQKQENSRNELTDEFNSKCKTNLTVKQISKKINNMKNRLKEKSLRRSKHVRYHDWEKSFLKLWAGSRKNDESLDTDTRSFNAMIPKPMGSSIPNIAEIVSSPDRLNEPADVPIKLETDYSLLKEEDDLESVSDISATNHWQTETKPDFQFNGFNEDDDNEQYESKSMNQLKRMALIAQTKMFKAQEAAARSKEQLNLYKVAILKQRNGDT